MPEEMDSVIVMMYSLFSSFFWQCLRIPANVCVIYAFLYSTILQVYNIYAHIYGELIDSPVIYLCSPYENIRLCKCILPVVHINAVVIQ